MTNERAIKLLRQMAKVLEAHAAEESKRIRQGQTYRRNQMAILGPVLYEFNKAITWFKDDYPGMIAEAQSDYDNLKSCSDEIRSATSLTYPGKLIRLKTEKTATGPPHTVEESRMKFVDCCHSLAGRLEVIADKAQSEKPPKRGRKQTKAKTPKRQRGEAVSGQNIEYTRPLSMSKWGQVFHASPKTVKRWRERGDKYHFDPVSPRKWRLPMNELPSEVRDIYRKILAKDYQK